MKFIVIIYDALTHHPGDEPKKCNWFWSPHLGGIIISTITLEVKDVMQSTASSAIDVFLYLYLLPMYFIGFCVYCSVYVFL